MALVLILWVLVVGTGGVDAKPAEIVIDAVSGEILSAQRPDHRHYPASLTKLMTLYLLFEALDQGRITLESRIPVSARAAGQAPSRLGLRKGGSLLARDAILALVTKSANDAATVVAEALAGSEIRFAARMTEKARALGMRSTTFRNATGLPNRGQVSTVRDMAKLARALYRRFPHYYKFFSTRSFRFAGRTYRNSNKLLVTYPGTDGLKTGYIRASGYNLVISAQRSGRRIIAAVFGANTPARRDRKMVALLDRGFATAGSSLPPPPRPKPTLASWNSVWAIQVGAFRNRDAAYTALSNYRGRISIADAVPVVVPVLTHEGGYVYRARFIGVTGRQARESCRLLSERQLPCRVVKHRPGETVMGAIGS